MFVLAHYLTVQRVYNSRENHKRTSSVLALVSEKAPSQSEDGLPGLYYYIEYIDSVRDYMEIDTVNKTNQALAHFPPPTP